jgi:hypothetical protein
MVDHDPIGGFLADLRLGLNVLFEKSPVRGDAIGRKIGGNKL